VTTATGCKAAAVETGKTGQGKVQTKPQPETATGTEPGSTAPAQTSTDGQQQQGGSDSSTQDTGGN
jgi:hypothetical protein